MKPADTCRKRTSSRSWKRTDNSFGFQVEGLWLLVRSPQKFVHLKPETFFFYLFMSSLFSNRLTNTCTFDLNCSGADEAATFISLTALS